MEWKWETPQQQAFETLKRRVTMEPILIHPDPTKQYTLEVDASGSALGAVLSQKGSDGKLHIRKKSCDLICLNWS